MTTVAALPRFNPRCQLGLHTAILLGYSSSHHTTGKALTQKPASGALIANSARRYRPIGSFRAAALQNNTKGLSSADAIPSIHADAPAEAS